MQYTLQPEKPVYTRVWAYTGNFQLYTRSLLKPVSTGTLLYTPPLLFPWKQAVFPEACIQFLYTAGERARGGFCGPSASSLWPAADAAASGSMIGFCVCGIFLADLATAREGGSDGERRRSVLGTWPVTDPFFPEFRNFARFLTLLGFVSRSPPGTRADLDSDRRWGHWPHLQLSRRWQRRMVFVRG